MTFSWQDIAALLVIAAAVIYLIMRLFRIGPWKRKSLCESCKMDLPEQSQQKLTEIK